jgi:phosphoribosylanthranilate isomerase
MVKFDLTLSHSGMAVNGSFGFPSDDARNDCVNAPQNFCRPVAGPPIFRAQMHLRIKICGITNSDDALAAVAAGADALGFMFYQPSQRHIALATAGEIIRALPPFVARVGVFVDATEEFVRRAWGECGLDTLQFHGSEPPEFCRKFAPAKVIKAFRIAGLESLRAVPAYDTHAWLLDSYVAGAPGGTGAKFNWSLAAEAKKLGRPIILAGGLTPQNVAEAVRQVGPFGVDVSSGVESAPGKKDPRKIREFIAAART